VDLSPCFRFCGRHVNPFCFDMDGDGDDEDDARLPPAAAESVNRVAEKDDSCPGGMEAPSSPGTNMDTVRLGPERAARERV